jgi:hypothetical protein
MIQFFIFFLLAAYHTKVFCGNLNIKQTRKSYSQEKTRLLEPITNNSDQIVANPVVIDTITTSRLIASILVKTSDATDNNPQWTTEKPAYIDNPTNTEIINIWAGYNKFLHNAAAQNNNQARRVTIILEMECIPIFAPNDNIIVKAPQQHSKSTKSKK